MPSGKKLRGKQRKKALKLAKPTADTHSQKQEEEEEEEEKCSHGLPPQPPSGHIIYDVYSSFIDVVYEKMQEGERAPGFAAMATIFRTYPSMGLQHDRHETRYLFMKFLESMGTNGVLLSAKEEEEDDDDNDDDGQLYISLHIAQALVALDDMHRVAHGDLNSHVKTMTTLRDLFHDDRRRTLTRFFARRISCDCLLELKKDVKQIQKTGLCQNCSKRFHIKDLKKCSKCKIVHYCSPQCQSEDWNVHKTSICNMDKHISYPTYNDLFSDDEEHHHFVEEVD